MIDVVEPKKERTSKKLNLGNCKENSGDEIFRILSEMSKQRREIIDSMPKKEIEKSWGEAYVKTPFKNTEFSFLLKRKLLISFLLFPSEKKRNSRLKLVKRAIF